PGFRFTAELAFRSLRNASSASPTRDHNASPPDGVTHRQKQLSSPVDDGGAGPYTVKAMHPEDLAAAIRQAIRAAGLSAGPLALASAVHKAVIARFIRGDRTVTVETAGKLLAALGCEIEVRGPAAGTSPVSAKSKGRRGSKGKPTDRPTKG